VPSVEFGWQHRSRAAGGTAGSPFQVPWIMCLAEQNGLGGRREPKLRRIRLTKGHQSSMFITLDQRAIEISHAVFPDSAPCRRDCSSQILAQIFECVGHTAKWPRSQACIDLCFCPVKEQMTECVQLWVECVHPLAHSVKQLERADLLF